MIHPETRKAPSIAIVGGGQAGMLIGFGLLDAGLDVTVFETVTPDAMRTGPIRSTAMVFDKQLRRERDLGLNYFETEAPICDGMHATLSDPAGRKVLEIYGTLDETCQGIDQRLKFSAWMEEFSRRGGELVIKVVTVADLEEISRDHDLTIVAAGKGDVGRLFERDDERTLFQEPPRQLGAIMLKNDRWWDDLPGQPLKFQFFIAIGEWFSIPFYSHVGPCRSFIFEAFPGGPLDQWRDVQNGAEALRTAKRIIRDYSPHDYPHIEHAEIVDDKAWLKGAITPTVRKPVGRLPSGRIVMAVGDTAIVNDPISGAGANDAVRMAHRVTQAIIDNRGNPYDEAWMTDVFEAHYHEFGRNSMEFTRAMTTPVTPPTWLVMEAASQSPGVAHQFANVYTDIGYTIDWVTKLPVAQDLLRRHRHELKNARFTPFEKMFPELAPLYADQLPVQAF